MGTQVVIPSPQHRYLEPFKNRVFQYDTKHSNLFLSHYVNQILNAVGDDSIVRGLEISPEINSSKTGINFKIAPGALVQDLTYFEFQNETSLPVEDVSDFSDYYIVLYASYRYIETVYENQLKFEATLYNPRTRRALSSWNTATNRIILGVFSFTSENGLITGVNEEDSTIFFEEANVVRNGTFDTQTVEPWVAVNSIINIVPEGGALDSPYIEATPSSSTYQGISQAFSTKPNLTYEVSFYVKSDESVPFQALVVDKASTLDVEAPEIKSYEATSTKRWSLHTFRFTAFSTQTTLFLLKKSASLDNRIDFDHICVFEYTPTRRRCELHNISMIDGGRIPTTEDIIPAVNEESSVSRWNIDYRNGTTRYLVDDTQPVLMNPRRGKYIMFFGGRYAAENEYHIDWKNGYANIYTVPEDNDLSFYFILSPETSKYYWNVQLKDGLNIYSPSSSQEEFPETAAGQYIAFYNGKKLDESYYTITPSRNTVQFDSTKVNTSISRNVYIYFISNESELVKKWSFKTSAGVNAYYLDSSEDPFLNESNGKYMVFLNNNKIKEEDYMIKPSEGVITLDSAAVPTENNQPLEIFYLGNIEEIDPTPVDEDFDVYKWTISMKSNQTVYKLDSSHNPFRDVNSGSYFAFKNKSILQPKDYSISPAAKSITFPSNVVESNAVVDIYFYKKNPDAKYEWRFQAASENQRIYSPAAGKPNFQSPDDGMYLVFLGDKQLTKSQYNMMYAANSFQISSAVSVPKNTHIQLLFISNPVPYAYWEFTTVANLNAYGPQENEKNYADMPEGEYVFFKDGIRLTEDEYKINPLKNIVSFASVPQTGGSKCEIYFMGKE